MRMRTRGEVGQRSAREELINNESETGDWRREKSDERTKR